MGSPMPNFCAHAALFQALPYSLLLEYRHSSPHALLSLMGVVDSHRPQRCAAQVPLSVCSATTNPVSARVTRQRWGEPYVRAGEETVMLRVLCEKRFCPRRGQLLSSRQSPPQQIGDLGPSVVRSGVRARSARSLRSGTWSCRNLVGGAQEGAGSLGSSGTLGRARRQPIHRVDQPPKPWPRRRW